MVRITWLDSGESHECTMADFCHDNPDHAARVLALPLHGTVILGGGAAPAVAVTRIARSRRHPSA